MRPEAKVLGHRGTGQHDFAHLEMNSVTRKNVQSKSLNPCANFAISSVVFLTEAPRSEQILEEPVQILQNTEAKACDAIHNTCPVSRVFSFMQSELLRIVDRRVREHAVWWYRGASVYVGIVDAFQRWVYTARQKELRFRDINLLTCLVWLSSGALRKLEFGKATSKDGMSGHMTLNSKKRE